MSKYIDADKVIAEIEKLKGRLIYGACAAQIEMETNCKDEAYNEVLSCIDSLQQEQPEVELENYISNKLHELGADLINHKPYSFNRGLNVGKTNAYNDILDKLNARKEE